jgi:hypothetical protein
MYITEHVSKKAASRAAPPDSKLERSKSPIHVECPFDLAVIEKVNWMPVQDKLRWRLLMQCPHCMRFYMFALLS